MKIQIPDIGDTIVLTKNWSFRLFNEYRNSALIKVLSPDTKLEDRWSGKVNTEFVRLTLPIGTVLKVNRVYIRQGASSFSSVTFTIEKSETNLKGRFWAKLSDVNQIEGELHLKSAILNNVKIPSLALYYHGIENNRQMKEVKVGDETVLSVFFSEINPASREAWHSVKGYVINISDKTGNLLYQSKNKTAAKKFIKDYLVDKFEKGLIEVE